MATVELPDSIERQLLALDRQVRDAIFSRGLSRVGVAVPVLLGVCLAVDWTLGLNSQLRMLLLGSWVLLTALVAWRQLIGPALRAPSFSELAALVERQHPELKERLTSLVELRDYDAPGASPVMRDLLARQTTKAIERIDISDAAPIVRSAGTAVIALAAIALLFAPFAIAPADYGLLWARLFAPWAGYRWGSLELVIVNGDRVVAKGSDVPIQAQLLQSRRAASIAFDEQSVWLHWTDDAGIKDSRRLEWDADAQHYATTLPHIARGLQLYATAKNAQSETHRIDVADPPVINRLQLDVEPPAYTGLPAKSLDGALGQVHAPERSRIVMRLDFNDPVTVAELIWPIPPETDPDAAPGDQQKRTQRTIAIKLAPDGRSGTVEALALQPGSFAIHLKNKLGLTNDDPGRTLVVEPDLPPEITLQGTDEPVKVRVEDRHIVSSEFHDDYGLTSVELHLETSGNQQKVISLPADELKERTLSREFPIDVADYDLKPGQALTYRFRAVDSRPIPNPQETWSKPRSLVVVSKLSTPPDQDFAQRDQTVKDQIDALRKVLAETKSELEKLHRKTEDEALKQKNSNKSEQLDKLEQRRAELAERLQKLAAELAERKLTEKLAERAEQLAQNELTEAGEKMEQAKQAEPRDQLQPLSEAIDRLASVDKQLQSLEQQLNDLNRLEQDLAQLEQVARNADRLADQLDKLEKEPRDPNNQAAEQLPKLQADGEKLADDLKELFKKHPELLDAARRDQLEQLQQLAQQAEQLSKPQQQLAQAFQDTAKQQQDQPNNDRERLEKEGKKPTEDPMKEDGDDKGPNAKPTQPGDGPEAATNPQAAGSKARAAGAQAAKDQQQLAQQATGQAIETARQQGGDSKATQPATDFARQAAEAAQQAATGDLSKAADQAQAAANSAEAAAKESAEAGRATPQQTLQAQSLAQRQQQLADDLRKMADSKEAQQGAQQQGQQQLADATESLAKQLEQAAKNLGSSPLDSKDASEAAAKANESAKEAQQAMQQAAQSAKSNDAQAAADHAKEAAEKLLEAARQADSRTDNPQSGQAIPNEVASQVTQAAQQFQEAQKQLGAAAKEKSQPAGPAGKGPENSTPNGTESKEQGQPGEGPGQGQPGQGQAGQGQAGQGQAGQGQPGQGDSAIAKTAKQFRNAAKAMRQAANGEAGSSQPGSSGQGNSQQAQGEPGTEQGPAGGPGGNQAGGVAGTGGDLQDLNTELKKQTQRNWGQLPGQLKTEILQGANKKPRPEYEKQIKSYFEEISKPATKQSAPN